MWESFVRANILVEPCYGSMTEQRNPFSSPNPIASSSSPPASFSSGYTLPSLPSVWSLRDESQKN